MKEKICNANRYIVFLCFMLFCIGVGAVLFQLMQSDGDVTTIRWDSVYIMGKNGEQIRCEEVLEDEMLLGSGDTYFMSAVLECQEEKTCLCFELGASKMEIWLDGERIYDHHVNVSASAVNSITIPLPREKQSVSLKVQYTFLGKSEEFCMPMWRIIQVKNNKIQEHAYDSHYVIVACICVVCALLSLIIFLTETIQRKTEQKVWSAQSKMIQEGYHALEDNVEQTNAIGHEVKNQILVMSLLYQERDYEKLGEYLQRLSRMSAGIHRLKFCKHPLLNTILQSYSARMEKADIEFKVQSSVPEKIDIEEEDLLSLIINLLNNALEGSAKTGDYGKRYVRLRLNLKEGFLVISCENSYIGKIQQNKHGKIISSKGNKLSHGHGIRQMEKIAVKYHSILDISYTDKIFCVRTALKLIKIPDKVAL